ncbi:hypothetical protein JD844_009057 [Phrynosoma platyrhinos]|uniref:EGF-like domain-containing protein n=1 Tax=Phrynosoma platyrhinos TaxID=52577 RepID=A0ABQ7TEN2_PHRPL|nr:hypothetical protein JD844_009057 [Phrynosoma platyrhinos]
MLWMFVCFLFKACEGEGCDNISSHKKLNTPLETFNVLNNLNSEKKKNKSSNVLPFTGITDGMLLRLMNLTVRFFFFSMLLIAASKLNKHCCQNGGTCFLGTFCICPKHFTGRHCEYDTRIRYSQDMPVFLTGSDPEVDFWMAVCLGIMGTHLFSCMSHFHRSCGALGHGEWSQEGCQLCRCIYGTVNCFTQAGCGKKQSTITPL